LVNRTARPLLRLPTFPAADVSGVGGGLKPVGQDLGPGLVGPGDFFGRPGTLRLYAWGVTRRALLTASAVVAVLAGCGGTSASDQIPKGVDHKPYVICSGKPRYCAVADLRAPQPHWTSATELAPRAARRFRRLVGTGSVPLPP
jgi:hypothetical protein